MKKVLLLFACVAGVLGMQAETFVKVTNASTLNEGDKVVMGYHSTDASKVSGGFSDTKKFLTAVDATFDGDNVTVADPKVITLKKNGSFWNLYIGSNVIGHTSGSNDLDPKYRYKTDFAISIESNGIAKIVSQTPGKNNQEVYFRYNAASPRFNVYAANSTAVDITLYKLDEGSVPEVTVTSVALNKKATEIRVGQTETLTATVLPNDAVDKTIAWGSTNTSVATVANGVVTAKAEGTAKIWVKATAVENVSDTCVVTVLPAAIEGNATYNAVKDAAYLPAGAKVFIGTIKDGENYVMGQYVSGSNIKGTAATYGEGRHQVTAPLQVAYTVERDGSKYLFKDQDGKYLRTASSSAINCGENDTYAKWTLGTFNEDDGTVELTASSGKKLYNNFQGSNDMFNIYSGIGDGSNLAKIVIYSDKAPEWTDRPKDPWIHVASTLIDWGKQEPDEYSLDWGDTRYVEMTMNDLPADIQVELTNDGNGTFSCYSGTISASKTSEKFLVYWTTDKKGVYEGEITLTCPGLETIKIQLHAEAIEKDEGEQPEVQVSADHIYLNPNWEEEMGAEFTLNFTASHLVKPLYLKWERDVTAPWFPYNSEYLQLWLVKDNDYVQMDENDRINLGTEDITDGELYLYAYAYTPGQNYTTQLHFTSYKKNSDEGLAVDVVIPIIIKTSEEPVPDPNPTTDIDEVPSDRSGSGAGNCTKVLRDGNILIIRNGATYDLTGRRVE